MGFHDIGLPLLMKKANGSVLRSLQAKVNALRELESATGEELDALLPSVLDRTFKGVL